MSDLLKRELWRILLCLCLLTAAAALLCDRMTGEALPFWIPLLLILWCLLLGLARRVGAWGPAVLCVLALILGLLPVLLGEQGFPPDLGALLHQTSLLPPALALCSLLLWYAPDRFALRAGAAAVWLGLWLCAALLRWELPRLTVAAMLPLPLLAVVEGCFLLRRRGAAELFAPLRGVLCLVLILASLLTMLAPAPEEPYPYPLAHIVIREVKELWHDLESRLFHRQSGDRQFSLSFDGLPEQTEAGEDGALPGGVLYLQPYAATTGPLYLFGNAWDRFDGRSWSRTPAEDESPLLWDADTMEHVYALWRWQQAHRSAGDRRFFHTNNIYIFYSNMQTRTMFSSMNALDFHYDAQRFPTRSGSGGILFDYMQSSGTSYRLFWLESNPRTLRQLISYSEGYPYDPESGMNWGGIRSAYASSFRLDFPEDVSLEELFSRRQALIRERDLDTAGVSPRAAALAAEITADCKTDYEKLRAIADYLQNNYDYTLTPTPVPEGENFLDWLLFETGEGYCTWFATAAALLGRSVGVPTRFVQGYLAGKLPTRRFTALTPEAAHAWCEGYIAGYGWVTVEATPGFSAAGGWSTDGPTAVQEEVPEGTGQFGDPEDRTEAGSEAEPGAETETERPARLWYLALLPLVLALILGVWALLRRRAMRQRYLALTPEEQAREDLARLLGYLRRRGYPRAPTDSVTTYFDSLPWLFLPVDQAQAAVMAELYESVLFGGHVPTPEELEAQRSFVETLRPRNRRLVR